MFSVPQRSQNDPKTIPKRFQNNPGAVISKKTAGRLKSGGTPGHARHLAITRSKNAVNRHENQGLLQEKRRSTPQRGTGAGSFAAQALIGGWGG